MLSFRLKTILGIASIEAVLLGILIFNTLNTLHDSNEKQLVDRVSTAVTLFATAAKDSVIASDLATLESLLSSLMKNPGMVYARILDADKRIIAEQGSAQVLSRYFKENFGSASVTDGIYDTKKDIVEADYVYGTVQIGFSITELQETFEQARKNALVIATIEMLLVALFSTFLGIYLTRQLTRLSEASTSIAGGEFGFQLEVKGKDEIASTIRAFNHMSMELKEYVAKIEQNKKELILAKNEAERASEAKSSFMSNMSHELRTPLNAVIGFSEILLLDSKDDEKTDALREIHTAGKHLLDLVNQILDLSKMDAGNYNLDITPLRLDDIIDKAAEIIRPMLSTKNVSFDVDFQCQDSYVKADSLRLSQSLVNLFSNAIQYNRRNGSVKVRVTKADENNCQITVQDTGMGIPADKLDEIFKPFNRLNQQDYENQGVGIGLSITRNLVELMGGSLVAESTLDVGSIFTLRLPLATAGEIARLNQAKEQREQGYLNAPAPVLQTTATSAADTENHAIETGIDQEPVAAITDSSPRQTAAPAATYGDDEKMNAPDNGCTRIVYVEDNPANMRLIEKLMNKKTEYELHTAVNGADGIEVCKSVRPHLVMLDINLPDYNGMEVLRMLREEHGMQSIPFIAITANAMSTDLEKFRNAGFDQVLTKPINVIELFSTIRDLLEESAQS